jgi:hypothetical protein
MNRWSYEEQQMILKRELDATKRPQRSASNPPKGCGPICPHCGIVAIKLINFIEGDRNYTCCRHCKKDKDYLRAHTRRRVVDKNYVPPKELIDEVLAN